MGLQRPFRDVSPTRLSSKRAIAMAEVIALAIDPGMVPAMGNLSSAHLMLGHDQQTSRSAMGRWQG